MKRDYRVYLLIGICLMGLGALLIGYAVQPLQTPGESLRFALAGILLALLLLVGLEYVTRCRQAEDSRRPYDRKRWL